MSRPPSPDGAPAAESVGSSPARGARRSRRAQVPVTARPVEPFPAVGGSTSRLPSLGYVQAPPPSQGTRLEAWGLETSSELRRLVPDPHPSQSYPTVSVTTGRTLAQHPSHTPDLHPEVLAPPLSREEQARLRAERLAARTVGRPSVSPPRAGSPSVGTARQLVSSVGSALASCFQRGRSASGSRSPRPGRTAAMPSGVDSRVSGGRSAAGSAPPVAPVQIPVVVLSF